MSSWYDAWADQYGDWSTGVTADVRFYQCLNHYAQGSASQYGGRSMRSSG